MTKQVDKFSFPPLQNELVDLGMCKRHLHVCCSLIWPGETRTSHSAPERAPGPAWPCAGDLMVNDAATL